MSRQQTSHMARAISVAEMSSCVQKHGAVIVKSGRVLSVGVNSSRNHPSICSDPRAEAAICAERAAIRACGGMDLRGAILYSARVTKRGALGLAKPCDRCQSSIDLVGIKRVFWTLNE